MAQPSKKGLNRHQKAARRPGEHRVGSADIQELIELAASSDPADRLLAAQNLCPCHVRRRVEAAWTALYGLMEDPDVRVRRAAWHTLEDGGCPTEPGLDAIFERAIEGETDGQVRRFVEMFAVPRRRQKEELAMQRAAHSPFDHRGKCDFCGRSPCLVRKDFATEIPTDSGWPRLAWICRDCSPGSSASD